MQNKERVSQREKCKHDHAPVLVCKVMNERMVRGWRRYLKVVFKDAVHDPTVQQW